MFFPQTKAASLQIPMAANISFLPFYFWTKSLLSLEHGNNELSPLSLYVIWMITLKQFDASKFYPNLEESKKKKDQDEAKKTEQQKKNPKDYA
jgi:hypothetical protein